jgi:dTDP-4-dehydrorhamnose 3,5-epimerase
VSLHIASGLAHGFLSLEPDSEVHYLMGAAYAPEHGAGVRWNDPAIGIAWPGAPALISERDADFPLLDAGHG